MRDALDAVPAGLGARFALEVRMGGRTAPMEYRIAEFRAPGPGRARRRAGRASTTVDDIRFGRVGDRTVIDYMADIRLGGLLRLVAAVPGRHASADRAASGRGHGRELAGLASGHADGRAA